MRPRNKLLEYNQGQVRHILNLCWMGRAEFAKMWGYRPSSVGKWINTAVGTSRMPRKPVNETICRCAKATLDMHVQECEIRIMRHMLRFGVVPTRDVISKAQGISKALVSIAIRNLVEDGVLSYGKGKNDTKLGKMDIEPVNFTEDPIEEQQGDWDPAKFDEVPRSANKSIDRDLKY